MNGATVMVCGVAWAVLAAQSPPPRPFDDFAASRNGFAFRNHFSGSSLPGPLALLHKSVNAPNEFGLCGGMSFAAADFYLAGYEPPKLESPPARGTPLYEYIYQRQVDSLGARLEMAGQFSMWMDMPDSGPLAAGRLTLGGLNEMLAALEDRKPVHLGLVYVSSEKTREPWHNHQVVATSCRLVSETADCMDRCSFAIYDPNFPGNDSVRIDVALTLEGFDRIGHDRVPIIGATCTQVMPGTARGDRTRNVRGMFPMPYEPKSPPDALRK